MVSHLHACGVKLQLRGFLTHRERGGRKDFNEQIV